MADSKVEIQVTANAEQAKRTFADVEDAANRAMDSGARSADKLSKSLDGVSKSAEYSARQIKGVVAGMAGMAAAVASSALKDAGHETAASYIGAAAGGAQSLAGALAPLGGGAMLAGAAIGAGVGVARNYFEQDAAGDRQVDAMLKLADALKKAREEAEAADERTRAFARTMELLSDTSKDADAREKVRAERMKSLQDEIDKAAKRMEFAEGKLRENAHHGAGETMTKEQEEYAASLDQLWKDSARSLATARGELRTLEGAKVEKGAEKGALGYANDRVSEVLSGLEKAGIGYAAIGANKLSDWQAKGGVYFDQNAAAMESLVAPAAGAADKTTAAVEDGNDIAERQLDVLRSIERKTTGTAVFA